MSSLWGEHPLRSLTVDFWETSLHTSCFWVPAVSAFQRPSFCNTSVCYDSDCTWSVAFTLNNYIHQDFQGQDQYIHRLVVFSKSSHSQIQQKATVATQNTSILWPLNTQFTAQPMLGRELGPLKGERIPVIIRFDFLLWRPWWRH